MPHDPPVTTFLPLKHDVVLILLALGGQPRHGYGIMREVEARSGGTVTLQTGALYRTLKRMLERGLIQECDAPRDADTADERRRYYRLTRLGADALAAEVDRMSRLVRAARRGSTAKHPRLA